MDDDTKAGVLLVYAVMVCGLLILAVVAYFAFWR
jgi:hypothetical protein